jgi:hypothetical protein
MQTILILVCVAISLITLGWLGLRIQPKPFPPFPQPSSGLKTLPLPAGLPAPVKRYYLQTYGESVPVIQSAVFTGRAKLRMGPVTFPGRFRFIHNAGKDYRHYIEATFFGLPLLKANEHYLDGKERMELPFGVIQDNPKADQAANLGMWLESLWLPSILLTDRRVRWEPVDADASLLVVPFGEIEERFVVRFDPETGMPRLLEVMRYKQKTKILWIGEAFGWGNLNGHTLPTTSTITWFDEGTPWAEFHVEEVVYNVDVYEYVRAKGL